MLALLGAWLAVARINRPLRALTRAAAQMEGATLPPTVEVSGPTEIARLLTGIHRCVRHKRLDDERALLLAGYRTICARAVAHPVVLEMLEEKGDGTLKAAWFRTSRTSMPAINQFPRLRAPCGHRGRSAADRSQRAGAQCGGAPASVPGTRGDATLATTSAVHCGRSRIQRLISNLLDNRCFTAATAVEVRTRRKPAR